MKIKTSLAAFETVACDILYTHADELFGGGRVVTGPYVDLDALAVQEREVVLVDFAVPDVETHFVVSELVGQVVAVFAGEELARMTGQAALNVQQVVVREGNKGYVVEIIFCNDDVDDFADVLVGVLGLELEYAVLFILFAVADIFLESRDAQVGSGASAVDIANLELANVLKAGVFDNDVVGCYASGLTVVYADVFAVGSAVNVGLDAVIAAVACGNKRSESVFFFDTRAAAVSDHFGSAVFNLDSIHKAK